MNITALLITHIEIAARHAEVWGFLIIFILMAIESSFIPLPSEVIMIPAGFLAYRCSLSFSSPILDLGVAILVGTLGSLFGAFVNYYLSVWIGRPILYKFGKYFFLKKELLIKAEEIFRKYGEISTFVCRLLPAIRHLISIPAGLSKMNKTKFSIFTLLGAFVWVTILSVIGYYLGHISKNMSYADLVYKGKAILAQHSWTIIISLVIIIIVYLYVHKKLLKVTNNDR